MRHAMRTFVVGLATALVVGVLPAVPAGALSCPWIPDRYIVSGADVIYVGVVAEELSRSTDGDGVIRYRMQVSRTVKGVDRAERTMRSNGLEGWEEPQEVAVGTRVLVVDNSYGLCSRSTTWDVTARARRMTRIAAKGGWAAAAHVVERGEWLWSLARQRLRFADGTPTRRQIRIAADKIYDRNRAVIGPDPDYLRAGTQLIIPRLR